MTVNKGKRAEHLDDEMPLTMNARPRLDRATQGRIGDQLRAMYTELMEQPVPDRFAEMLTKLEQQNRERTQ